VATKGLTALKFLAAILLGLLFAVSSTQGGVGTELPLRPGQGRARACYQRQETALAEKRKQATAR